MIEHVNLTFSTMITNLKEEKANQPRKTTHQDMSDSFSNNQTEIRSKQVLPDYRKCYQRYIEPGLSSLERCSASPSFETIAEENSLLRSSFTEGRCYSRRKTSVARMFSNNLSDLHRWTQLVVKSYCSAIQSSSPVAKSKLE